LKKNQSLDPTALRAKREVGAGSACFIKRLYIRPKYANAERIVIAPLPARLIEKCLPARVCSRR
jgi:hypothetical protein